MIKMPKGYNSSETSVHFMGYHFVWCPKYRRKVLDGEIIMDDCQRTKKPTPFRGGSMSLYRSLG